MKDIFIVSTVIKHKTVNKKNSNSRYNMEEQKGLKIEQRNCWNRKTN